MINPDIAFQIEVVGGVHGPEAASFVRDAVANTTSPFSQSYRFEAAIAKWVAEHHTSTERTDL